MNRTLLIAIVTMMLFMGSQTTYAGDDCDHIKQGTRLYNLCLNKQSSPKQSDSSHGSTLVGKDIQFHKLGSLSASDRYGRLGLPSGKYTDMKGVTNHEYFEIRLPKLGIRYFSLRNLGLETEGCMMGPTQKEELKQKYNTQLTDQLNHIKTLSLSAYDRQQLEDRAHIVIAHQLKYLESSNCYNGHAWTIVENSLYPLGFKKIEMPL